MAGAERFTEKPTSGPLDVDTRPSLGRRTRAGGKAASARKKFSAAHPVRVLLADDHQLILEGLKLVLAVKGIEVVGEASSGRLAVERTLALSPDVVILDIRMPDMDGLEALASIKSAKPDTSVIILTSYANPEYFTRAVTLGAAGFVSKSSELGRIPQAVKTVAEGDSLVDPGLLQAALKALMATTRASISKADQEIPDLTPQEVRILSLVAEGLDNAGIAALLSLSRNTIKTHVHNIFTKLGVSDRTQAAIWAMRHGLVA